MFIFIFENGVILYSKTRYLLILKFVMKETVSEFMVFMNVVCGYVERGYVK